MPISVCDDLDKISRNFVWGGSEGQRKVHMISWNNVCKSKEAGGLGLRSSRKNNHAFMMKAGWNVCSNRDSLLVQVIIYKYGCGDGPIPKILHRGDASNFWRGICRSWADVKCNLLWGIRQGNQINFWPDNWVSEIGPL